MKKSKGEIFAYFQICHSFYKSQTYENQRKLTQVFYWKKQKYDLDLQQSPIKLKIHIFFTIKYT